MDRLIGELHARHLDLVFAINCRVDDVQRDLFSRLRQAGLVAAYVGVESGARSALERHHKGIGAEQSLQAARVLRELDVKLIPSVVPFDADTTLEELKTTIGFLRQLGGFHVTYLKMMDPMRGTPLVEAMQRQGLLRRVGTGYESISRDPRVELVRRMVISGYRPVKQGLLEHIYPLWYWMLGPSRPGEAQLKADVGRLVQDVLAQDLAFVEQVIRCIEQGDLSSYYVILSGVEHEYARIKAELGALYVLVTRIRNGASARKGQAPMVGRDDR
jgi:hypothetical protein